MKRKNKYHARRCGDFDSQAEKEYGSVLELLKRAGKIQDYKHHPPTVKLRCMVTWRPDYLCHDAEGEPFYVEVKSPVTHKLQAFRMVMKLYRYEFDKYGDQPPVYVVQRYGPQKFKVIESIIKTGSDKL